MYRISFAGSEEPQRTVPLRVPATRYERKWMSLIEPMCRTQAAMDDFNRRGLHMLRERGMPETFRGIVKRVSTRRRVAIMLIASASRMRIAVEARNEAMYLIKESHPKVSSPQIGKWFGRDHTSVLHGIASHQERHNLPKLVGYDLGKHRENYRRAA